MSISLLRCSALAALSLASASLALAQGGSCKDPWINQAYNQLYHRAPSGSVLTGECNITLYGGGHWTTFADLESKIIAVRGRPTAVQAPAPVALVKPSTPVPLSPSSSLVSSRPLAVIPESSAAVDARKAQLSQYHVDFNGNLVGPAGILLARSGQFLISASIVAQGGGNIVAQGGGNIVAQGGGNIAPSAGMLINASSSNFIVGR